MPEFKLPTGQELWEKIRQLAEENDRSWRFTKKGDRRPREDVERALQTRRENDLAKRRAIAAPYLAELRAKNLKRAPPEGSIVDRMLLAMEPGGWYGMGDLARLADVERHARGKVHQVLRRRGWIERAQNPQWKGSHPDPRQIEAGAEPQPKWLYRLTATGVERRNALRTA